MPAPSVCAKCRQISAAEGDSWCSGCSAWEFLGRERTSSWDSKGARLLASDVVVSAARQVKALRSLSAGLCRDAGGASSAGGSRAEPGGAPVERNSHRESLPRRRSVPSAPPPPIPKEEGLSDDLEEETEEETDGEGHREVAPLVKGGHHPPPEPEGPPPGRGSRQEGHHHHHHSGRDHRDRKRPRGKETPKVAQAGTESAPHCAQETTGIFLGASHS